MRLALLFLCASCATDRVCDLTGLAALASADDYRVPRQVAADLESVRAAIGSGACPGRHHRSMACVPMIAEDDVLQLGIAAVPYLARAFDDRDDEVANFALHVAVVLDANVVGRWCDGARDVVRLKRCEGVELREEDPPAEREHADHDGETDRDADHDSDLAWLVVAVGH